MEKISYNKCRKPITICAYMYVRLLVRLWALLRDCGTGGCAPWSEKQFQTPGMS